MLPSQLLKLKNHWREFNTLPLELSEHL